MPTTLSDDVLTVLVDWGLLGDPAGQLQLASIGLLNSALVELSGGGYGRTNRFFNTITDGPGTLTWDGPDPVFTCPAATVRYAALFRDGAEPTPDIIIPLDSDAVTSGGDTVTLTSLSLVCSFTGDITASVEGEGEMLRALTAQVLVRDERRFTAAAIGQTDMDAGAPLFNFDRPSAGVLEAPARLLTGETPGAQTTWLIADDVSSDRWWEGNVSNPITTTGGPAGPLTSIEMGAAWARMEVSGA